MKLYGLTLPHSRCHKRNIGSERVDIVGEVLDPYHEVK